MSATTPEPAWLGGETQELPPVRRRLRGLRVPVLPSGTLLAQVVGGAGVIVGVGLQFGLAVTLIVSGAAAVLLGALKEAGKI